MHRIESSPYTIELILQHAYIFYDWNFKTFKKRKTIYQILNLNANVIEI